MKARSLILILLAATLTATGYCAPSARAESPTRWFTDARFGMFIHWGVYSIPARGEWVMHNEKIQVADYEKFYKQFNPTEYNPREWVRIAKAAGMKYMTITTKHHDGFCMFDTKLGNYSCMYTPAHRDFVKGLVDACHEAGMKIEFYYSLLDWHQPYYEPKPDWQIDPPDHPKRDMSKYLEYMHGQVRELCTNYGKIDGIWFDGGWEHSPAEWKSEELIAMIRQLQPGIIINDRAGIPEDFSTPEQTVPGASMGRRMWESCMTINGNWGYAKDDKNFKSVADLVHILVDCASKGGNLLLNVGPMPNGKIQPEFVQRLAGVGKWMARNGESVYRTRGGPFLPQPWGRATAHGSKLYLHVFDWPKGTLEVPGLLNEVRSASLLLDKTPLSVKQGAGHVVISLPDRAPDAIDSVIVLEVKGAPKVDNTIRAAADGSVALPAMRATVHGGTAHYESGGGKDNIGYWVDKSDWVSWDFTTDRAGDYTVDITYACDPNCAGSQYTVAVGASSVAGTVKTTGDWAKFITETLGTIHLDAGKQTLAVTPVTINGAVMNLQKVVLKPAK
jgi:alpha-L-fucosidase